MAKTQLNPLILSLFAESLSMKQVCAKLIDTSNRDLGVLRWNLWRVFGPCGLEFYESVLASSVALGSSSPFAHMQNYCKNWRSFMDLVSQNPTKFQICLIQMVFDRNLVDRQQYINLPMFLEEVVRATNHKLCFECAQYIIERLFETGVVTNPEKDGHSARHNH